MRLTALVLGLIGGIIGIFTAAAVLALAGGAVVDLGGYAVDMDPAAAPSMLPRAWLAFFLSVAGGISAAMLRARPRPSMVLMFLAGLVGTLLLETLYVLAGLLLMVAAIVALQVDSPSQKATAHSS